MEFEEGKQYVCALGTTLSDDIKDYAVGRYQRGVFSFSNGSYSNTEYRFNEKMGSNIACVLRATPIDEIEF